MSEIAYTYSGGVLTVFVLGEVHSVNKANAPRAFNAVLKVLNTEGHTVADVLSALEATEPLKHFKSEDIEVKHGVVFVDGKPVHNALTERILEMLDAGLPIEPMKKFMANLSMNPSDESREQLFAFLDRKGFPITEDGCFLGYKGVNNELRDQHSNTFDNSVGQVCEMPRDEVCADPELGCAPGLHVGTLEYARGFAPRMVLVKVNPADAVSVPTCETNKLRVCKYEVVRLFERVDKTLSRPVYSDDDLTDDDDFWYKEERWEDDLFWDDDWEDDEDVMLPDYEAMDRNEVCHRAAQLGYFRNMTEARDMGKDFVVRTLQNRGIPYEDSLARELGKLAARRGLFSSVSAATRRGKAEIIKRLKADGQ